LCDLRIKHTKPIFPSNGEVPVVVYSDEHVTMEIDLNEYQVTNEFKSLNEVKPVFIL